MKMFENLCFQCSYSGELLLQSSILMHCCEQWSLAPERLEPQT